MSIEHVRRACILLSAFCLSLIVSGCARPRPIQLPSGSGTPLADVAAAHADVSKQCGTTRTLTAELGLSGRAGDQKMRGRALAGFQAPDAMRLEGLAPFGPPAFILATHEGRATLLLPRDHRVLRDAPAGEILGALTGVTLAPADLQAVLSGCVVPSPKAIGGAEYGGDWRRIDLEGGATLYLRRVNGVWQLRAANRGPWRVEYPDWQGSFPRAVRLISTEGPAVDVTASLSQIETNVDLDPSAFTVDVPDDAIPVTLEELRDAGPLRPSETSR